MNTQKILEEIVDRALHEACFVDGVWGVDSGAKVKDGVVFGTIDLDDGPTVRLVVEVIG